MRGSLQTEEGGDTGLFSPLPQAHEIAGWVTFCVSESSPHGRWKGRELVASHSGLWPGLRALAVWPGVRRSPSCVSIPRGGPLTH